MDHWLVSVKFAPKDTPTIGGERWTWPINALNDEPLMEKLIRKGVQTQAEIEELRNIPIENSTNNPQQVWSDFKNEI